MELFSKEKAAALVTKIQQDPTLLKEFQEAPAKTIEKAAGINIPDFLEPKIESIVKEAIKNGTKDPMSVIEKFL